MLGVGKGEEEEGLFSVTEPVDEEPNNDLTGWNGLVWGGGSCDPSPNRLAQSVAGSSRALWSFP